MNKKAFLLAFMMGLSLFLFQTGKADFVCPRDFAAEVSKVKDCQSEQYQNTLSRLFFEERKLFQEKLNTVYQDNAHHPEILSTKIIEDLRESHLCFYRICQQLVNACSGADGNLNSEFTRSGSCNQTAQVFFQIHSTEASTALRQNTTRKQRSVFRETARQFEIKLHQYFAPLWIRLLNELNNFDSKFTNFTANPA